jgi:hypothetical protein
VLVFAYPKALHSRRNKPPVFSSLRPFKGFVREEFFGRCVYCRAPDLLRLSGSYGIDHYRPKVSFKHLQWDYSNLYWCCHGCNSRKRNYWPSPSVEKTEFVPNPCDHRMFVHLKFQGSSVEARSRAGEVAVALLDLNHDDRKRLREQLQTLADTYDASRKRALATRQKIDQKLASESDAAKRRALQDLRTVTESEISKYTAVLDDLSAGNS